MKFSLCMPFDQHEYRPEMYRADVVMQAAQAMEEAGFDACFVTDHPFPTTAWMNSGGHNTLDPLVHLSFAAASTSRLMLHTNCYIPAYRDPFVSAKAIATLDAMSGGRVILGVAVGYLESEFDAIRVSFKGRGRLLDEQMVDMIKAWAEDEMWDDDPNRPLTGNKVVPKPDHKPHPPIWIGGNSEASLKRAVSYGDGWVPFAAKDSFARAVRTVDISNVETLGKAINRAQEMAAEAGREKPLEVCFTPFSIPHYRDTFDPDEFLAEARELESVGVGWVAFHLPSPSVQAYLDNISAFGRDIIPALRPSA